MHQVCVSVCTKNIDKNQIILNLMKYAMCNIHINYSYSKYFICNDSNFILFHCDFTYNFTLRHHFRGRNVLVFSVSQLTLAVYSCECRISKQVSIQIF